MSEKPLAFSNRTKKIAFLSCLFISPYALADTIFSEDFSSGFGQFSDNGRAYLNNGSILLRGGSSAGSIYSNNIDTSNFQNMTFSFDRSTSGLESYESLNLLVSYDGQVYQVLNSDIAVNGTLSIPVNNASQIRVGIELNASSYFETATLDNIVLEGTPSNEPPCETNCPGNGESETVIIPDATWDCSMPNGIPQPEMGELLFTATLPTSQTVNVGQTPMGIRKVIPTLGGNISGDISGEILSGALDFELALPSGAKEYESRYTIETSNGSLIYMRNCGVADGNDIRFVTDFEAPNNSAFAWLNQEQYIGTRKVVNGQIEISVYANLAVTSGASYVHTPSDNQLVQQSWDCPTANTHLQQGREILSASVGIGSFQTIGDSKYGSRRIIPITGGSFSGDINGDVNAGGADFQLTVNDDLSLEARYTLQAQNGENIVVRNCGDFAQGDLTTPYFEANINGSYNWLNEGEFVGTITPLFTRVIIDIFEAD